MDEIKTRGCTSLDHIYAVSAVVGKVLPGTLCYCGKRIWGPAGICRPAPAAIPEVPLIIDRSKRCWDDVVG